jgi:hypothetical protein
VNARAARFIALVVTGTASVVVGCLDATEITLDITTDSCSSLKTVEIYVGTDESGVASAPSAVANACSDPSTGEVGNIRLVPSSGISDRVSVAIVGTLFGGSCTPDSTSDPSCIIARRSIAFSPHRNETLDIRLSSACAGVFCEAPATCEVDPKTGIAGCQSSCQTGCASDAGPPADVVITPDVIVVDSGPPLQCVAPMPLPTTTAYWTWSFSNPNVSNVQDDKGGNTHAFAQGAMITADTVSPCSSFLRVGGAIQQLAVDQFPLASTHLAITLYFRAQMGSGATVVSMGGTNGTLSASFDPTNRLKFVVKDSSINFASFSDSAVSADGKWHFLYIDIDTQLKTLTAYRDGVQVGKTTPPSTYLNGGPLWVGPSLDVDQVQFFPYASGT